MNIGELFVTLGIKGQGLGTLKEVAQKIADLPIDAAAAIAGLAGVSFELSHMAEEALKTAVSFQMFSAETGLSWQELQKWQIVAEQANVSAESVASSIGALQRNLAEIRLGRGNIAPFQMLGISPNQDAFGVIEQLRKRIRGLNPAMATNLISQMGLSPDMMHVLQLTDKQFAEFANHVHGLTERQYKDFLQAKELLVQFGQTVRYVMFGIIGDFTEAIEKSLQFKQFLTTLAVAAGILAVSFFPVTAAVAGLILVLDDLAVYATGGKSLTGVALRGFKNFFDELQKDHPGLKPTIDLLERLAGILDRIGQFNPVSAGAALRRTIEDLIHSGPGGILQAIRSGEAPAPTTNQATINMHVNGAGSLDAPGWSNVAHMVKRAVEDAHLQLNN